MELTGLHHKIWTGYHSTMTGIEGQAPEPGQDGGFLTRHSTSGTKVDFVDQTTVGFVQFTLGSGLVACVNAEVLIYDPTLPNVEQNQQVLKSWNQSLVWPFFDIFIDTNNLAHQYGVGSSLTSAQKNILVGCLDLKTPSSDVSAAVSVTIKNFDSSSHIIYFYLSSKYIILE